MGASVTAYLASTAPAGSQCVSEQRTCSNGVLSGSYAYPACSVAAYVSSTPSGWDYDLTKKCIRTIGAPGDQNYYAVEDQCISGGGHWLAVVESENAPGASSPRPANRSFTNATNSPVSMQWIPRKGGLGPNWTVHMKVDQNTHPHPSGSGYFTFFSMMDHAAEGGGPLPWPQNLVSEHTISYNQWTPGPTDAARMVFGAQFWYGGKAHLIEIILASSQWGDSDPDPQAIVVQHDWLGTGGLEYVLLGGSQTGLSIPLSTDTHIRVPWNTILKNVIAKGWFAPIGDQPSVTQAVYVGVEAKNSAVADLWHTDFRISSSIPN